MGPEQSVPPSAAPLDDLGVPEETIRGQLATVLASPEFAGRPVLRNFLSFVVENVLAGRGHEIKGYTVAIEVFGRKESFDGLKDSIVRIQAGRLRRALERYYANGGNDSVRIEIPKGTYVPTFHKLETSGPDKGKPSSEWGRARPTEPHGPSVAVMPLVNLTGDPGQEYFVDGLTEELTQELARFQGLSVVASYSTLQMKGEKAGVREMGQRLGARFLVQGGVRREADLIKISVRLIDTTTELQVWGDQYRRQLRADSLITVQEDIARRVAARVGSEYGIVLRTLSLESRKKPPESLATYEAFLRFYHYLTIMSPETYAEAFSGMERATTREPDCGLAWSLLALLYLHNHSLELSATETPLDRALSFAQRGASLEPQTQLVRIALANVYFLLDERDSFLREATDALSLNPNAPTLAGALGWMMMLYGEWKRGLAIFRKAIELNPYYPGYFHMAPYLDYFRRGKYEAAYREAQQFKMPLLFWDPLLRAAALGQMGRRAEAGKAIAELLQLRPDFAARGHHLIGFYVKSASLRDGLLDGLRKAGLPI
jgi:adenylate cyclase